MNREILIPYLQDVCALHLAKKKHQDKITALHSEIRSISEAAVLPPPAKKEKVGVTGFFTAGAIGGSAVGCGLVRAIPVMLITAFDKNYRGGLYQVADLLLTGGMLVAVICFVMHLFLKSSQNEKIEQENRKLEQKWRQQSADRINERMPNAPRFSRRSTVLSSRSP